MDRYKSKKGYNGLYLAMIGVLALAAILITVAPLP